MTRVALGLASLVALAALVLFTPRSERVDASELLSAESQTAGEDICAPDPKADAELVQTAQGMFKDLKTTTLDNGLRVMITSKAPEK